MDPTWGLNICAILLVLSYFMWLCLNCPKRMNFFKEGDYVLNFSSAWSVTDPFRCPIDIIDCNGKNLLYKHTNYNLATVLTYSLAHITSFLNLPFLPNEFQKHLVIHLNYFRNKCTPPFDCCSVDMTEMVGCCSDPRGWLILLCSWHWKDSPLWLVFGIIFCLLKLLVVWIYSP